MKVQCIKKFDGLVKKGIYKVQNVRVTVDRQIENLIINDNGVLVWVSSTYVKPYISKNILCKK